MIVGLTLIAVGIFLSAFFSGSETGFYRVTRVRLVMDAKSGRWIARCLLWMVGHPSVVVATVLIGNNLANYVVSLGLVIVSQEFFSSWGQANAVLPVLATPFLFIYGELLPKYLYYNAPYFLSSKGAPLMVLFTAIFLPVSSVIIGLEAVWQKWMGHEAARSKFSLERQELQRVLMEGQEAGLLLPIQREIAQNLFTYGVRPVRHFAVPLRAIPLVKRGAEPQEILEAAQRFKQKYVGVLDEQLDHLAGCYQVGDVVVSGNQAPLISVCKVRAVDSHVQALTRLQSQRCPIAQVVDAKGKAIGLVSQERLMSLLLPTS